MSVMVMMRETNDCFVMIRAASCMVKNAPLRLVSTRLSHSCSVTSSSGARKKFEALVTSRSSRSKCSPKAAKTCSISATLDTSHRAICDSGLTQRIFSSVSFAFSSECCQVKKIEYPCPATARAISLPSLPEAPVMKHTFFPETLMVVGFWSM